MTNRQSMTCAERRCDAKARAKSSQSVGVAGGITQSSISVDSDVFGNCLASWRPRKASKGILEAIRFISTENEPVGRHSDLNPIRFHDFPDHPICLPAAN